MEMTWNNGASPLDPQGWRAEHGSGLKGIGIPLQVDGKVVALIVGRTDEAKAISKAMIMAETITQAFNRDRPDQWTMQQSAGVVECLRDLVQIGPDLQQIVAQRADYTTEVSRNQHILEALDRMVLQAKIALNQAFGASQVHPDMALPHDAEYDTTAMQYESLRPADEGGK